MKRTYLWRLVVIVILAAIASLIVWPGNTGIKFFDQYSIHQGLDLKGGAELVYGLDTSKISADQLNNAIESVRTVITQRVDQLGVSEAVVEPSKAGNTNTLIVELPGITDIDQAKQLIGTTAKLEFWEQDSTSTQASVNSDAPAGWKVTDLTGSDLKSALVQFDQQTNAPQIGLTFNSDGAKLFDDITKRNLGKQVAIALDGQPITSPVVQSEISSGQAQITGSFTVAEAKNLAIELNAGALPVPVNLIEQQTIGATLGADSVKASLLAGVIGLGLVMIFMVLYYGFLGVLASIALALYTLFIAAFVEAIPVTMSLAGIAGIILSIGMAVDANILIFERMKEELRAGKTVGLAIDQGFKRAWQSIRDSNVSSIITASILYFTTTGLVRGFALTLILGILLSMFTAIFVTRTFLKLALREKKK